MLEHLSERQQELTFSLALLLTVGLGFAAIEETARLYKARLVDADVDWNSMIEDVGYFAPGEKFPRFHPNTQFKHLNFNNFGFRGPSLTAEPQPNTVRIAFLGNSVFFGGEFVEDDTVGARTTRFLKAAVPNCNFEYSTVAGPSYSMDFLAELWAETAPVLHADMAVILAGTVQEMIKEHDTHSELQDYIGQPENSAGSIFDKSAAIAIFERQLVLTSPVAADFGNTEYKLDTLSQNYASMSQKLVTVTKGTPVVAVGYRSALRSNQTPAQKLWASRNLRATVPGLNVDQAVELSDFIVDQLQDVAADANWKFIDPLKDIAGDREQFRDFTHLTDKGMDQLASKLAEEIKGRVMPNCKIDWQLSASQ